MKPLLCILLGCELTVTQTFPTMLKPRYSWQVDRLRHEVACRYNCRERVRKEVWLKREVSLTLKGMSSSEDFPPESHQIHFHHRCCFWYHSTNVMRFVLMTEKKHTETMNNPWRKTLFQGIVWHFSYCAHLISFPRARSSHFEFKLKQVFFFFNKDIKDGSMITFSVLHCINYAFIYFSLYSKLDRL